MGPKKIITHCGVEFPFSLIDEAGNVDPRAVAERGLYESYGCVLSMCYDNSFLELWYEYAFFAELFFKHYLYDSLDHEEGFYLEDILLNTLEEAVADDYDFVNQLCNFDKQWFLRRASYFERINKVLYESMFNLPIGVSDADFSNYYYSGVPHIETPGAFYFFINPYLELNGLGLAEDFDIALVEFNRKNSFAYIQSDWSTISHGLPSEADVSICFYRNRSFVRLLEVDNPLIIPFGTNVKLSITADDVIHSWAVPSFGIKIDAIPGRINETILIVLYPGIFMGQCSELCGIYHSFMPINVEAIHPDIFFEEYNFIPKGRKIEE